MKIELSSMLSSETQQRYDFTLNGVTPLPFARARVLLLLLLLLPLTRNIDDVDDAFNVGRGEVN